MATRMQQRRGTAAQWISTNSGNGPILNAGEIGWESDTNKFKVGDGVSYWADLDYFADINSTVNPAFGSSITFEGATADFNYMHLLIYRHPRFHPKMKYYIVQQKLSFLYQHNSLHL